MHEPPPAPRFRLIEARRLQEDREDFARSVEAGLTRVPKQLPCRFFYDAEGSRLFEAITDLPEYYLTRTEQAILAAHADQMVERVPRPTTLIELGSGTARKTRLLIEALLRRQDRLRFVPLDIAAVVLRTSAAELLERYPQLEVVAVAGEYHDGFAHLADAAPGRARLVLWLGSSIGNFEPQEACAFLRQLAGYLRSSDRVLIGVDLDKDPALLEPAYNDAAGVTARFNKNLLARINRELGGHFDLDRFAHRAVYNREQRRVEMYLVSTCDQAVAIDALDLTVRFARGETVHTENSYKYTLADLEELAGHAGLVTEHRWFDDHRYFCVNLLRPRE